MKKIIFLAVIIAAIATSCQEKRKEKVGIEINLFLEDCISRVPNASHNKFTRKALRDTIISQMNKKTGEVLDLTRGLPMKVKWYHKMNQGSEKDSILEKYIVKFEESYYDKVERPKNFSRSDYEVLAIMNKKEFEKIIDYRKYIIEGKFMGYDKDKLYPEVSPTSVISPFVIDPLIISLGTLVLEDVKIEPFEEDNM